MDYMKKAKASVLANAGIQLINASYRFYKINDLFEELFVHWIPAFARKTMALSTLLIIKT
jgi:hypothetical protein